MASFLIFIIFIASAMPIYAHDFGCYGNTYPIEEQNILAYLEERLLHSNSQEMQQFAEKQVENLKSPKSLKLPNAKVSKITYYDPSITAKEDIKNGNGDIIVAKGTCSNPLDSNALSSDLLFFDATQEEQLDWAKAKKGIWILVKGKPLEIEESEGRATYFDQFGYLTKKLSITSIPASVTQENKRLKIEEHVLEGRI